MSDENPGWDAIDRALAGVYGDVEPHHWGTLLKFRLGGDDPLDGISVYPHADHWHYVSYGMTELYEKESDNPDESGWGFEFTFRLARSPGEGEPPIWAANLMQNLARYVYQSGNWFEPGHHINPNGPIAADRTDSKIRMIAFAVDPELGEISTPHGKVQFLQIVGLTPEEYEAANNWSVTALLELFAARLPLLVTDIDRDSLLTDPELAAAVQSGTERDGSDNGGLFVNVAGWDLASGETTLKFGALPAERIAQALRGRLPFGRDLLVSAEKSTIIFRSADTFTVEQVDAETLEVGVPDTAVADLIAALQPVAGRTPIAALPGLVIEIEPTRMLDDHGNETGEVIG